MASNWLRNSRAIAYIPLTLLILVTMACGTASPSEDTAPAPAAQSAPAAAAPAPESAAPSGAAAAPAPADAESVAPTAVAKDMPEPDKAMAEVNPGKLTWMIGNFGHERFDPTYGSSEGHDYGRLIHAFLISSDVQDERRISSPGIVTKWEVSSDGLTWTYTVREGVKFHDGSEVTMDDVLWTLQHTIGAESKDAVISPSFKSYVMDRIELTGPNQISATTTEPISDFPLSDAEASGNWRGIILPQRANLHDEADNEAYDLNPIGAGIFQLVDHVPADSMTFERFEDYYQQPANGFSVDRRPNFATLELLLVPEEATRVAALRAGDADIAPITMGSKNQVEAGGGRVIFR